MSVLLEHDTIVKSRRALIISSVVVIALHYVQLNSEYIEIFKLQVAVSKASLIIASKLSTGYLLYIFILQSLKIFAEYRVTIIETRLELFSEKKALAAYKADYDADMQYDDGQDDYDKRFEHYLGDSLKQLRFERLKLRHKLQFSNVVYVLLNVFVDTAPAVIFALLALTDWHTIFT